MRHAEDLGGERRPYCEAHAAHFLQAARRFFYERRPRNLRFLLQKRYEWMNHYVAGKERVVELGCGAGLSKEFITGCNLVLTDCTEYEWIDLVVDALDTPFEDESWDAVICSQMVHHLAQPVAFFREMHRILKKGGYLLIQDLNTSLLLRTVLRLMRHEGWSYDVAVFDEREVANDPRDPWSSNTAIPQLLFGVSRTFEERVPGFQVVLNEPCECLIFLISGGVNLKTYTVDLPDVFLKAIDLLDGLLTSVFPSMFALGRRVALKKIECAQAVGS